MFTRAFLVLALIASAASSQAGPGQQCTEDIVLVNDQGCSTPCCVQSPPGSGQYVFLHTEVESIDIRNNSAAVVSVSFPNLVSVAGRIRISYNQPGAVASASFPSLRSAGAIDVTSNPGLVQLELPRLRTIVNDEDDAFLKLQSNPSLTVLDASALRSVSATEAGSAYLEVDSNGALGDIDFPSLQTIEALEDYAEAYLAISRNDLAHSVSMDSLRLLRAGSGSISYLIVDDMLSMQHLSFPQLTELLPTGGLDDFSELTVGHSPQLTEFVFPKLRRVSLLQLTGLQGTSRAMFPSLKELQYLWVFGSCADPTSTLQMTICSMETLMDVVFDDNGLCGPAGYMLSSENPLNAALCDLSDVCQSFVPGIGECKCGSPGLCSVNDD
jgi:hypothetical protein